MGSHGNGKFRFGEHEIDVARRSLTRNGKAILLNTKAFNLLCVLVENRGRIMTKAELLDLVWPEQFVEENNISVQISVLRKALGEDKDDNNYISTITGSGYTFVAEVERLVSEVIIENHSVSRVMIEEVFEETTAGDPNLHVAREWNTRTVNKGVSRPVLVALMIGIGLIGGLIAYSIFKNENNAVAADYKLMRLTNNGKVANLSITPDGDYAIYSQIDADGESLWLRHISTSSQQQILPSKPTRYIGLSVTPDGNYIYATTYSDNIADPQLWKIAKLGGAIEVIDNITTGAAVTFSPDGKKMAFTESRSSKKQTQLLVADANGDNKLLLAEGPNDVRSFPNFNANPVAWSPDGKQIAVAVGERINSTEFGILLIESDGSGERFISERRWDLVDHLAWVDNETLVFSAMSIDQSRAQLWSVSRSTGEIEQLTSDLHSYGWVAGARGKIISVQKNPISRISIADFNFERSRIEFRDIVKESGNIDNIAFTLDGSLVYSSIASGHREIWTINADGSGPRQLTVNANVTFGIAVSPLDGSIVYCATKDGNNYLRLVSADGRINRDLTVGFDDVSPHFAADGRSIIFQKGLANKIVTLHRLDLDTLTQRPVSDGFAARLTVSPIDSTVAYYYMDDGKWRIRLISPDTGAVRQTLELPTKVVEQKMRWFPDGNYIGQIVDEGENLNLLILPTNGGPPRTITSIGTGIANGFDWSRDGKQFAIAHMDEQKNIVFISRQN